MAIGRRLHNHDREEVMQRRDFLTRAAVAGVVLSAEPGQAGADMADNTPLFTTDLAHLEQRIAAAAKKVGQVVFVRYLLHGRANKEECLAYLSRMARAASGWIGQKVVRVHAVGSAATGQLSLTLEYEGGASASLNYVGQDGPGDGVNILVLGNHGSITYDWGTGNSAPARADYPEAAPGTKFVDAVTRSLKSGRPESVQGDEQP
jgi:hypothetical protein